MVFEGNSPVAVYGRLSPIFRHVRCDPGFSVCEQGVQSGGEEEDGVDHEAELGVQLEVGVAEQAGMFGIF